MGKAATPLKAPTTKKRRRALPHKKKVKPHPPPPLPPPHLPMDLAEKLEKIQEHSNMVVKHVNTAGKQMTIMTQHVHFLHQKLLEQSKLYAIEFRRINNIVCDLEDRLR